MLNLTQPCHLFLVPPQHRCSFHTLQMAAIFFSFPNHCTLLCIIFSWSLSTPIEPRMYSFWILPNTGSSPTKHYLLINFQPVDDILLVPLANHCFIDLSLQLWWDAVGTQYATGFPPVRPCSLRSEFFIFKIQMKIEK